MKTTIEWFTPAGKIPKNGRVVVVFANGSIDTLHIYNGHYNCFSHDTKSEIQSEEIALWSYIPKKLEEYAEIKWEERNARLRAAMAEQIKQDEKGEKDENRTNFTH